MLEDIGSTRKVVGVKQSARALKDGTARKAYIALDAEERVTSPVRTVCAETGVPVVDVPSMTELGAAAGIETGASVVVLLR